MMTATACSFDDSSLDDLRCEATADCTDPTATCVSGYCVAAGDTDTGVDTGTDTATTDMGGTDTGTDMGTTDMGTTDMGATDMGATDSGATDSMVMMCSMHSDCAWIRPSPSVPQEPASPARRIPWPAPFWTRCDPSAAPPTVCASSASTTVTAPAPGNTCLPDGTCSM